MLNKKLIFNEIVQALEHRFITAQKAAQQARDAATDEESVAENKYDTFGLEASYLAHGQSERVQQCEMDWLDFKRMMATELPLDRQHSDRVQIWSIVHLQACNDDTVERYFLLSHIAGGLQIPLFDRAKMMAEIILISPSAPVGRKLLDKEEGDIVGISKAGQQIEFEIVNIK